MYAIIPQQIPQDRRAEVNEKILFAIDSGKDLIPAESIYNCYTGIGGLHNLKQSDFANYNEYAEAKKEYEMPPQLTVMVPSASPRPAVTSAHSSASRWTTLSCRAESGFHSPAGMR